MSNHSSTLLVRDIFNSAKWGVITLLLVNGSAAFTGISLGFGWLSGCAAIVLGAPGVIGLLLLNAILY